MLPVIFFGHGNPMNALFDNDYTRAWRKIGREIPKPAAILAISAHWYVSGTAVTTSASPATIHDFGGFPKALYEMQYPAPGDPALARRVQQLLAPVKIRSDAEWGLDHGTWSVLTHLYPDADVPVVQLSIDNSQPASLHYDLGRRLAPLRSEGVLIMGSGNLVHNLRAYGWGKSREPYDWAVRFEQAAKQLIASRDHGPLIDYEALGADAALAIPTAEHYLPLLYVLGAARGDEPIRFPVGGIEGGSISMLAVQIG